MKQTLSLVAALCAAWILPACSPVNNAIGGSCRGTQALGPVTVNICSESPSATVDQQLTLNSSCRSGQLGAAANDWHQSEACPAAGRVGGCQRPVQSITVTTWVYSTDPSVDANAVQQFCASLSATYVAP